MSIRLNKFLATYLNISRQKADVLIEDQKVKINQRLAKLGDQVDIESDKVSYAGKLVSVDAQKDFEYWLLNKPIGVISSTSDELGRKTVFDYVKLHSTSKLYPVGRLDADSQGLILLSNDGQLTQRLIHPQYEVAKVYEVEVEGIFAPIKIDRLLRGVKLAEGIVSFDQIQVLDRQERQITLLITIHQGIKREIRRACAKVGWEVRKLARQKIGDLELAQLKPGQIRKLNSQEIAQLKKLVNL